MAEGRQFAGVPRETVRILTTLNIGGPPPAPVQHPPQQAAPAGDLQSTLALMLARMESDKQEERRIREQELANQRNMVALLAGRLSQSSSSRSAEDVAAGILNPSRGHIGIIENRNPDAAREAGASLGPLYALMGDLSTMDVTAAKLKLKSGMNPAEQDEVLITKKWPNQYLPRVMMRGKVNHCDLNEVKLAYGLFSKIYCEAPREWMGSPTINKLRMAMALFRVALVSPWPDVLSLDMAMFQALERRMISWENWSDLELWWTQTVDMMRTMQSGARATGQTATSGTAGKRAAETPAGAAPPSKAQKRAVMGVPGDWMRSNHLCIKFNLGRCSLAAPHESPDKSGNLLRHLCGGCLYLKKGQDGGHGMTACPNKPSSGVFA